MINKSFRSSCVEQYICDIVIFLYKIGEALLDSSIRPYISTVVCSDMFDNFAGQEDYDADDNEKWLAGKDHHRLRVRGYSNFTVVCSELQQLPVEIADDVQQQAAGVLVTYRLLVSIPAVILGLFCGAWSDREGYKLPMMSPSVGSCAAVVFYLLSLHVRHAKVALLLTGAAMQGFFGKTSVISMAVNSHVSHTSDSEQRTHRLGRLMASSYLGMFLGSLLAGVLQDVSDFTNTLIAVSVCHAVCVFAVLLGVKEVVAPDHGNTRKGFFSVKRAVTTKRDPDRPEEGGMAEEGAGGGGERKGKAWGLFSWQGLRESVMAAVRNRDGGRRCVIVLSFLVLTLTQILKVGDQDVTVMFVQHYPLSWPSYLYGYLTAAESGMMGVALLLLLPVLSNRLCLQDIHFVLLGIIFKLVRALWAGFCSRTWMMFASVLVGALGGVVCPALRSILTKTAQEGEVGKLFAIQAALETLSKLVGSAVFTGIYAATVDIYPPAAYLSEVVVYLLTALLVLWLGRLLKDQEAHRPLLAEAKPKYSIISEENSSTRPTGSESPSAALASLVPKSLPINRDEGDRTENRREGGVFQFCGVCTP
ncbi:hypothetical protein ACOMHN_056674 [Nucella lapillus]